VADRKLRASLRRLRAVATKEVRQLSRDRVTFGMIVGVPLLQILLFGFAINFDVRHLATISRRIPPRRSTACCAKAARAWP
jgi:ABC-type amino acid transport system permease subunit